MLATITVSALGAAYLFFGLVNWLTASIEMLGDNGGNSYVKTVNTFSRTNTVAEVLTVLYLFVCWPLHLALKWVYKA